MIPDILVLPLLLLLLLAPAVIWTGGEYTEDASEDELPASNDEIAQPSGNQSVTSEPKFTNHQQYIPQSKRKLIGHNLSLECKTTGNPSPNITWYKDGRILVERGGNATGKDRRMKRDNCSLEDSGNYTCNVCNKYGCVNFTYYVEIIDPRTNEWLYMSIAVLGFSFVLASIILLVIYWKCRRQKKKLLAERRANVKAVNQLIRKIIVENQTVIDDNTQGPLIMPVIKIQQQRQLNLTSDYCSFDSPWYEFPLDSKWEIDRKNLTLGALLGEGAFGKVVKAEAFNIPPHDGVTMTVAVKMLKEGHTDDELTNLISEMEIMKMIGKHPNIISLLGCCTQNGPFYVIVEYAHHGNLKDLLARYRPLFDRQQPSISSDFEIKDKSTFLGKSLVSFACQIAKGMEYLASRQYIHRDLAARNVLVSQEYVMKIADFGLSRHIDNREYYRRTTDGCLPIKWMSPEVLFYSVYTTYSDVWSFGILLWEMTTLGGTPYPSVPDIEKLYELLRQGYCMEMPSLCSIDMYRIMKDCWNYEPSKRPTFTQLVERFDGMLKKEYVNMEFKPQFETPPDNQDPNYGDSCADYLQINGT